MKRLLLIILILIPGILVIKGQYIPYQPGEKVVFTIKYGFITSGASSLELRKDTLKGKEIYHSVFSANTVGLADAIFRVKDIYESYFDSINEMPEFAIRNAVEGRYKRYNTNIFDRTTRKDSAIIISNLRGKHVTEKEIRDVISLIYYFRTNWLARGYQFKKDEIVTIVTWFTDEYYPIRLVYAGQEWVRAKGGKILCYKFNPVTEVGSIFKTNEDVSIWFSADKNYLPVKLRFNIFVGAFTAELQTWEGLKTPLEIN
ncbi:MAG TPA: DUF3108 domain-containing protein [Bacteroidales bacterium]|nr:DUF3108 domain-containing protein [Bacteroidales bacterium]